MKGPEFEGEVRKIARALWPSEPGAGAPIVVDGRERDCIFEQEHVTHYVEITVSRTLDNVRDNVKKMIRFREEYLKKGRPVKLWIVTLEEPTGEQRTHCRNSGVEILSMVEFRRRIIDASQYLELRLSHSFGSATDPGTDSSDISGVKYQPVVMLGKHAHSVANVASLLEEKRNVLLLGDYGMGKSITIRQIFLELRKRYFYSKGAGPIPVVVNLREHWGQDDPMEALRRHADLVGFEVPGQLVRAFNAGRLVVLLDGFDEISAIPWGHLSVKQLRLIRKRAVRLIANFVSQARGRFGLLIAGREHFFDSREELSDAFGLRDDCEVSSLTEFTDEEAGAYLKDQSLPETLPDWFPKRPLLLAFLAARGLIQSVIDASDEDVEPAVAWDKLVDLICQREAQIHQYLTAEGIRRILERLASMARSTASNLGPITEDQIAEAFRAEVSAYPDEAARSLLQRLPGLSARNQQDGTRSFLDDHMLDVLRAGRVFGYVLDPWNNPNAQDWKNGLGSLGAQLVADKLAALGKPNVKVLIGAKEAIDRWNSPTLALDLIAIAQALMADGVNVDFEGLVVKGGDCELLDLANLPFPEGLIIRESTIEELILPVENYSGLIVEDCIIGRLIGGTGYAVLPDWIKGSEVLAFDEVSSNARILEEANQPLSLRVMLTILRKLYDQKGSGRRENALFRGLDSRAQPFVQDILKILAQEKLAFSSRRRGNMVWHAVAGQQRRAFGIIEFQARTGDPTIERVRSLTGL